MTQLQKWRAEAERMGEEAARAAASWITDGNDTDEFRRWKLASIEADGVASVIIYPNLSGEMAGDPTAQSITQEITGQEYVDPDVMDELADAWEEGVNRTLEAACVAELTKGLTDATP